MALDKTAQAALVTELREWHHETGSEFDSKWGEVPVLFIEGKEANSSNLMEHEAWGALASYKRPREIRFLRIFPRNRLINKGNILRIFPEI